MDIQWSMIWLQGNSAAAKSRRKHDGLADPLERAEWQGLLWAVPLFTRLTAGARTRPEKQQKIKEVERFTGRSPAKPVCVS